MYYLVNSYSEPRRIDFEPKFHRRRPQTTIADRSREIIRRGFHFGVISENDLAVMMRYIDHLASRGTVSTLVSVASAHILVRARKMLEADILTANSITLRCKVFNELENPTDEEAKQVLMDFFLFACDNGYVEVVPHCLQRRWEEGKRRRHDH